MKKRKEGRTATTKRRRKRSGSLQQVLIYN
jgi:hypothetical protein